MRIVVLHPIFIVSALIAAFCAAPAAARNDDVVSSTFDAYSLSAPTPLVVVVCHGFGCRYRTEVGFSPADRARLAQIMGAGRKSPEAERQAVGVAGAWFDRRVGPSAGTQRRVARAGYKHMNDAGQFDCIDTSRNITSLLLVLDQLKLLRHHSVEVPKARGYLIDGRPPHVTAVLSEKKSGTAWTIDSWTRGYGEKPEIMQLERWMTLD